MGVRLETYVTAHQVDSLFSTQENRDKALLTFQEIGIDKVYLETVRSGYIPNEQTLKDTIAFLQKNGIEVTAGVATLAGPDFGTKSNDSRIWLNYQTEKTQQDLSNHFRHIATLFDEIMIDDFFATNDTSEISQQAKGNQSWSEYRLDLMMDFAKRFILQPAREANPDIRFILKYPQWYDRFHKFGYDVVRGPEVFERLWVGTETRNPNTVRYGYVMPTQGYINFSWLRSIAGEQAGGAWFDFGDCTPEVYLMQAYQSVLAGAQEIILFEAGSVINKNPCIEPFLKRRDAVKALGKILNNRNKLGLMAYKPPNSDGSDSAANLYVYDYLATLGFSPVPVAEVPDNASAIFLPRQAADDLQILEKVHKWISKGVTLVVTPDFLSALSDSKITEQAGYEYPLQLSTNSFGTEKLKIDDRTIETNQPIHLRKIPSPTQAEILCSGITAEGDIPIFTQKKFENGSQILVLNLSTFTHEEFGPGKEEFLPPRELTIQNWPNEVVNRMRNKIPYSHPFRIEAPNNVGMYFFEGNCLVLANFNDSSVRITISFQKKEPEQALSLNETFPHDQETRLQKTGSQSEIMIPAWELAVLKWME